MRRARPGVFSRDRRAGDRHGHRASRENGISQTAPSGARGNQRPLNFGVRYTYPGALGASDVHLKAGQPPGARVRGDLVFFDGLGHVGIYIGSDRFIHAPHTGDVVRISSLTGWYDETYVGASRVA